MGTGLAPGLSRKGREGSECVSKGENRPLARLGEMVLHAIGVACRTGSVLADKTANHIEKMPAKGRTVLVRRKQTGAMPGKVIAVLPAMAGYARPASTANSQPPKRSALWGFNATLTSSTSVTATARCQASMIFSAPKRHLRVSAASVLFIGGLVRKPLDKK